MRKLDIVKSSNEISSNNISIKKWSEDSLDHRHDFFELFYVKKGCILHSINNSPYTEMHQGDYMFVDIGSYHSFYIQDSEIINIEFTSEAISKHLPLCNSFFQLLAYPAFAIMNTPKAKFPIDKILHDKTGYLASCIDMMNKEINNYALHDSAILPYIIKHHMIALILHIMMPFYEPEVITSMNPMVQKMIEIIALHYADPNPLAIASRQLSYSPSVLSTLFKNNVGINFKEYVQRFRIDKAKYLLTSTDMKVSIIASDIGYSDIKFFSKLFKEYEGMTPSEYRRSNKHHIPCVHINN